MISPQNGEKPITPEEIFLKSADILSKQVGAVTQENPLSLTDQQAAYFQFAMFFMLSAELAKNNIPRPTITIFPKKKDKVNYIPANRVITEE